MTGSLIRKPLRPIQEGDAEPLFPLVYQSSVTDTMVWDGPESLDEFRQALAKREVLTAHAEGYVFAILNATTGAPIGTASIRPESKHLRADIGLWIGEPYQGYGLGSLTVRRLVDYGFERLGLQKIEANVFVGNQASRRIFEKNGFLLERTTPCALLKRGQAVDEWVFGITRQDYLHRQACILHLCKKQEWKDAQSAGEYRAASLEAEGFIHCSRAEQILDVANQFYRGDTSLVLLVIERSQLESTIRWDYVDADDFPHIYGPINLEAITAVLRYKPDVDGKFRQFPAF